VLRRVSPREFERMMRRMGVKVKELECEEVVFVLPDRQIAIKKPRVVVIEAQGEKVYQVSGEEVETVRESLEEKVEVTEDDVKIVAEQAGVSMEEARKALEETGGDLAQAIVLLQARRGDSRA
jgi:nascent polypeptide-associated complex subunit alpha